MDVAYYISELLGQLGEVNVPGLGNFARLRVDGYYNETEAVFYPPQHKVTFKNQSADDDVFYQYIARKKKISLASSKYFTEKYINNLKEQASANEVELGDIGWLYNDGLDIAFKPAEALPNNPVFYGYPQIQLNKLEIKPPVEEPEPVIPEPELPTEPEPEIEPEPEEPVIEPPYKEHPYKSAIYSQDPETYRTENESASDGIEERSKSVTYIRVIVALVIVAALSALVVFGLYRYDPTLFHEFTGTKTVPIVIKYDSVKTITPVEKADTTKSAPVPAATDTTTQKSVATPPVTTAVVTTVINDTLTKIHYELLGGAFGTAEDANTAIGNYKKIGISAHIINNGHHKLHKVTLGTYFNYQEASNARDSLLKTKKISKNNISLETISPQKTNQ
jgi:cell division septation protein DedD